MSSGAKRRRVVERSEKSRVHKADATEILRFAMDDIISLKIQETSCKIRQNPLHLLPDFNSGVP